MREKTRRRIAEGVAPFLEQGETMRTAVPGYEGPRWALFFGLIGALMTRPRLVVLTERKLSVLEGGFWSVAKPRGVVEQYPFGSVEVRAERGFPVGPLHVGGRRIWVARPYQDDAAELAASSSAG